MACSTVFLLAVASSLLISASKPATPCASHEFSGGKTYAFCLDLPVLSASLYWTYDEPRSALSLAFAAPPARPDGWISWAINPTAASGMKGSQALIALKDATGQMTVKTFNISEYALPAATNQLWFHVEDSAAEFSAGVMTLFASLVLPEKGITVVKHVWQVGSAVDDEAPAEHASDPDNLKATGTIDLSKGRSTTGPTTEAGADTRTRTRNIHGLLNVISWGFMFPAGVVIARYLRVAWFYLHVSCQVSAYAVGVAGWATGLKLGSDTHVHSFHRNIGIALFALATLQIFALVLRPDKNHKYRPYWNVYHHVMGYAIIALGITNVFKGFHILNPHQKWTTTYIAVIAVLGGIALFLEAITWTIFLLRKRSTK